MINYQQIYYRSDKNITGAHDMAEYFNTAVELKGKNAVEFYKYDENPWKHETPESLKIAKRARKLAETQAH